MTRTDFMALLPILVTAYASVVLMLVVAFRRSHMAAFVITLLSLAGGLASIPFALRYAPKTVTPLIRVDGYALYFTGVVLAAAFLITLLSYDYLRDHERRAAGYYLLILFAVVGMEVVISSAHFASFFLGLETLSVSLYGLIGYTRDHRPSLEGAMKYLILAAASSAFLLLGIALVYTDAGTLEFGRLSAAMMGGRMSLLALLGLALILVLFGFKLALAPFHMWSPDVYQGAPAPVTGLIATGSKGAMLAILLKLFLTWIPEHEPTAYLVVAVISIATMFIGNLLALMQTNVKRLLAYSSVANMGYLLIPLIAGGAVGASSIGFYLVAYFAAVVAAFGVIAVISARRPDGDVEAVDDYRGLGARHPVLAVIMVLALVSLTGIPPTAGFLAKFYIFSAALRSGLWALVIIGVINSGISAFYYLRVVLAMYSAPEAETPELPGPGPMSAIALGISTAVMLIFGVYPGPLIRLVQAAVRGVGF